MKPTWVVFDIGGVLFDWRDTQSDIAQSLGVTEESLLATFRRYVVPLRLGRATIDETWSKVLHDLNRPNQPQEILSFYQNNKYHLEDTLQLVQELAAAGYRQALFSNTWPGLIDLTIKPLPQYSCFTQIVDSSKEHLAKPDPQAFALVEKRLGVKGGKIYFIDDSETNIAAAKERGRQTFRYELSTYRGQTSNDLIRKALL